MSHINTHRILFVLTSQAHMGDTDHPTGFWFEELAAPWWAVKDAGHQADIAAIQNTAVADPLSLSDNYKTSSVDRFLADSQSTHALNNLLNLKEINIDSYSAIFLVGGHGAMWDFPDNKILNSLLTQAIQKDKIIAAVCHGVAGLCGVNSADNVAYIANRKMCGFSNEEEIAVGASSVVPFLLEDRLRERGSIYESAAAFHPKVVVDGNLITGQNPQSSTLIAEQLLALLVGRKFEV